MGEREWAARLEADLGRQEGSLRNYSEQDLSTEYRRVRALGRRLATYDFSPESRAYGSTLEMLKGRHGRGRLPWLVEFPHAVRRLAPYLLIGMLLVLEVLLLSELPELNRGMAPVAPQPSATATGLHRSLISLEVRDAINLALIEEASYDSYVYSYDPELRIPTRLVGVWEAPYGDTLAGQAGHDGSPAPGEMVWAVRLEGEWWDPTVPEPHEWLTKLIEVAVDPRTDLYRPGAIAGAPPYSVRADDVPDSYVPLDVTNEAIAAINASLEVESLYPPASEAPQAATHLRSTRIERVVLVNPRGIVLEGGPIELSAAADSVWAVRLAGRWEYSEWQLEQGEVDPLAGPENWLAEMVVILDPESGQRLATIVNTSAALNRRNQLAVADEFQAHLIQPGDTLHSIAEQYGLEPETVAWSAYQLDGSEPAELRVGRQLLLPPIDGAFYTWRPLDTLQFVAEDYGVDPAAIIDWPSNGAYTDGGEFAPGVADMIFVPMPADECELDMLIPIYFRCR